MERRSFLALLPMMPMAGKLMVTMPKKYIGVEDLAGALKHFDVQVVVDNLFQPDPLQEYFTTQAHVQITALTDEGKELLETWHYDPEVPPGAPG